MTDSKETLRRLQDALFHLQRGLAPFVDKCMKGVHRIEGHRLVRPGQMQSGLAASDVSALLKTMIAHWREVFEQEFGQDKFRARAFVALTLDARNALAHHAGSIPDEDALRYLDATQALLKLTKAPATEIAEAKKLFDAQRHTGCVAASPSPKKSPRAATNTRKRTKATVQTLLLDYMRKHPDLDDDELSFRLGIEPRQTINQAARRLEAEGRLARFRGPKGKIVNRAK